MRVGFNVVQVNRWYSRAGRNAEVYQNKKRTKKITLTNQNKTPSNLTVQQSKPDKSTWPTSNNAGLRMKANRVIYSPHTDMKHLGGKDNAASKTHNKEEGQEIKKYKKNMARKSDSRKMDFLIGCDFQF